MKDAVKETFEPIPELSEDPVWTLADVIGKDRANAIEATGTVRFHAAGDTGAGQFPIGKDGSTHFGALSPADHAVRFPGDFLPAASQGAARCRECSTGDERPAGSVLVAPDSRARPGW